MTSRIWLILHIKVCFRVLAEPHLWKTTFVAPEEAEKSDKNASSDFTSVSVGWVRLEWTNQTSAEIKMYNVTLC